MVHPLQVVKCLLKKLGEKSDQKQDCGERSDQKQECGQKSDEKQKCKSRPVSYQTSNEHNYYQNIKEKNPEYKFSLEHSYSTSGIKGKTISTKSKKISKRQSNENSLSTSLLFDLNCYTGGQNIEIIEGNQYRNYHVPGNGNCFFNCLSLILHGNFSKSQFYRHAICQKVINEWDHLEDLATLSHDLPARSVTQYWLSMVNKNGWATVCELKAACDLLYINI